MSRDPHKEEEETKVVIPTVAHTHSDKIGPKEEARTNHTHGEAETEVEADLNTMDPKTHGGGILAHRGNNTNQIARIISLLTLPHAIDGAQKVT
jgi:hypothetical protein